MPCVALLLAFPPPNPLQAEIIWRLQNLTAGGASWLLSMAGLPVELEADEHRSQRNAIALALGQRQLCVGRGEPVILEAEALGWQQGQRLDQCPNPSAAAGRFEDAQFGQGDVFGLNYEGRRGEFFTQPRHAW